MSREPANLPDDAGERLWQAVRDVTGNAWGPPPTMVEEVKQSLAACAAGMAVVPNPRQPAYDAVFEILKPHDGTSLGAAHYALIWRAVHAALNAAQVGAPVDPDTGQRL